MDRPTRLYRHTYVQHLKEGDIFFLYPGHFSTCGPFYVTERITQEDYRCWSLTCSDSYNRSNTFDITDGIEIRVLTIEGALNLPKVSAIPRPNGSLLVIGAGHLYSILPSPSGA